VVADRGAWQVTEFDPGAATPDAWARYHAFRRARHAEVTPDDPVAPDDVAGRQLAHMHASDPESEHRWFVVEADGQIVSRLAINALRPETPMYETNRHLLFADAAVLAPYRRRGIGSLWLRRVLAEMDARGATVLTAESSEPDGHGFLAWLGARQVLSGAENRLDFEAIDWGMVDEWIAAGKRRSPETELVLHEGRLPEAIWVEFCARRSDLLNTMPFDDMDHGEIVFTPEVLASYYERLDIAGGDHHTLVTREPDGTISGITDVLWESTKPTFVAQLFTGVDPAYRRAGKGKLLKAGMLRFLRGRYDGLAWVTTGNAASNASMLAINHQLGFREHRGGTMYQMDREALAAFVEGL